MSAGTRRDRDELAVPIAKCCQFLRAVSVVPSVERAILEHLSLWDATQPRPPPVAAGGPVAFEYVPCED